MIFCIFFLRESFVQWMESRAAQESSDLRKANEKLQVRDAEMRSTAWGATDQDHLGSIKMEDLMGFYGGLMGSNGILWWFNGI